MGVPRLIFLEPLHVIFENSKDNWERTLSAGDLISRIYTVLDFDPRNILRKNTKPIEQFRLIITFKWHRVPLSGVVTERKIKITSCISHDRFEVVSSFDIVLS